MSEMVERVARATMAHHKAIPMCQETIDHWRSKFANYSPADQGIIKQRIDEEYLAPARAAIDAMREPTNQMVKDAFAYFGNDPHPFAEEWAFMVNSALCDAETVDPVALAKVPENQ